MISLTLFRVNTFPSIFNQRIKINLKLTKHYSVKGRGCFKPIPWFKKGIQQNKISHRYLEKTQNTNYQTYNFCKVIRKVIFSKKKGKSEFYLRKIG
jgi:hypothetical protein